jgi:hypothetical protein
VIDVVVRSTMASWQPLWIRLVAHGSAAQGETIGQHDGAVELTGRLDDIGVVGGLGVVTSFDGGSPVVVTYD